MPLIDRSPGLFIVFANLVVYGVVGVEIWMWTVSSTAAVACTMALIIGVALMIGYSMNVLLGDAVDAPKLATEEQPQAVEAPAAKPERTRRPRVFVHHAA